MPEKEFEISITNKSKIFVFFETKKGKVERFAVVLLFRFENTWQEISRYDTLHGTPHRDYLKRKFWLELPFDEALKFAIEDFKKNWKKYLRYFKI